MTTPSVTPAQIKADVLFVAGIATSLGLHVSGDLSNGLAAALIAAVTLAKSVAYLADMLLRKHRVPLALAATRSSVAAGSGSSQTVTQSPFGTKSLTTASPTRPPAKAPAKKR